MKEDLLSDEALALSLELDDTDPLVDRRLRYWSRGVPSDELLIDFITGLLNPSRYEFLSQHLNSNEESVLRLEKLRRSLFEPLPADIESSIRARLGLANQELAKPSPELSPATGGLQMNMKPIKTPTHVSQSVALSDQIAKVISNATAFTYVTNFMGGRPKASYEVGHSHLKFYELESITSRLISAMESDEEVAAVIIIQDFEAVPELIIARQLLRLDDKYLIKNIDAKLEYVAGEIASNIEVINELWQALSVESRASVELRATKGLIAMPTICSELGSATGYYLSNLSDFNAPTQWFDPLSSNHALISDHCEVYRKESLQILGDNPHERARSFLNLGMNRNALFQHFKNRVSLYPTTFPEFYVDHRELLGPEF